MDILIEFWQTTGFAAMSIKQLIMIIIALVFLYLAIKKEYEPYLLIPIAFGMLLVNMPLAGLMEEGSLLYYIYQGTELGIYPPLIFLCVGAGTDFGPLIANPKSVLLGAAGVSAVPMAARVAQKVGQKENPSNFLLMHAMGPNVAGVIGSAVAAGLLLMFFG